MTTTSSHPAGSPAGSPARRRVAIGTSVGATIETYDFIGFGTAAALYFNTVFFPSENPTSGLLLSFATLGIGFAVRPLGGIIGGHLGDRIGRKPVLVGSLLLMGIATVLIGLLPTYQQVGVWAGVLLVAVRVVQGLAFGAEWGGAILMCYEHAPWRKRGLYTGITQAGFPVGLLLANFAFLVSAPLGEQWAWRVPFLASALLIVVGIVIRLKVEESPEFEELQAEGEVAANPMLEVIRGDWRNVLRAFCLRIAETAAYAVSVTFVLSYLATEELADRSVTLTGLMVAAGLGIGATIAWGALTDRVGRRPVYILGSTITMVWGVPLFLVLNTGVPPLIVLAFIVSYAVCQNSLAGVQGAWFPELFDARTRTSGASLAYQLSAVVAGFTPFIATALYASTGWIGPALLISGYGLLGVLAALITPETWGPEQRATVADQEAEHAAAQAARQPAGAAAGPGRRHHPPAPHDRNDTMTTTSLPTGPTSLAPDGQPFQERVQRVQEAAFRIRRNALTMGEVQGQGYIGQALGVADVLAALYADRLTLRPADPHWDGRDRFLLSIGHYAIALYAALVEAGVVPEEEMETYGSDDSRLPMSAMASYTPGVEISGGSLGHGLAVATGIALGLRLRGNPARVVNLLSDGELDEGSTWEAALAGSHHELDNLLAVVDVNALQADGPTAGVLRTEPVLDKWRAFGWEARRVDGNDVAAILTALDELARVTGRPAVLICDTRIGQGVPMLETREKAHFMRVEEHEWQIAQTQLADNASTPSRLEKGFSS